MVVTRSVVWVCAWAVNDTVADKASKPMHEPDKIFDKKAFNMVGFPIKQTAEIKT
jgi:hypothetical protein